MVECWSIFVKALVLNLLLNVLSWIIVRKVFSIIYCLIQENFSPIEAFKKLFFLLFLLLLFKVHCSRPFGRDTHWWLPSNSKPGANLRILCLLSGVLSWVEIPERGYLTGDIDLFQIWIRKILFWFRISNRWFFLIVGKWVKLWDSVPSWFLRGGFSLWDCSINKRFQPKCLVTLRRISTLSLSGGKYR